MRRADALRHLVLAALALCAAPACAAGLSVQDAWIAAAPPVVPMNAGYLRLDNDGATVATLTAVESPRFASIEMHESTLVDGVNTMRRREAVEIPAGGTVTFAPGGLHLMLMRATAAPDPGEVIPLTLVFADGLRVAVQATVRSAGDASHGNHHH